VLFSGGHAAGRQANELALWAKTGMRDADGVILSRSAARLRFVSALSFGGLTVSRLPAMRLAFSSPTVLYGLSLLVYRTVDGKRGEDIIACSFLLRLRYIIYVAIYRRSIYMVLNIYQRIYGFLDVSIPYILL
jgi:hypothetical protein